MKKYSILLLSAAVMVSSCTTTTGAGAYAGSSLGSILGSAIGGITGGPRGSDVGTIIGMASGAIVGAAVGNAAEKQQQEDQSEVLARRNQRIQRQKAKSQARHNYANDGLESDNVYAPQGRTYNYEQPQSQNVEADVADVDPSQMVDTTNSSDDRIDFDATSSNDNVYGGATSDNVNAYGGATSGNVSADALVSADANRLEIRNVRFVDDGGDGVLQAGETGKVTFEVYNHADSPSRDVVPTVVEADANRYIYISPSILVEEIAPGQGIRYTATVKADRRLKADGIRLLVSAVHNGEPVSYVTVVKVRTARK